MYYLATISINMKILQKINNVLEMIIIILMKLALIILALSGVVYLAMRDLEKSMHSFATAAIVALVLFIFIHLETYLKRITNALQSRIMGK